MIKRKNESQLIEIFYFSIRRRKIIFVLYFFFLFDLARDGSEQLFKKKKNCLARDGSFGYQKNYFERKIFCLAKGGSFGHDL